MNIEMQEIQEELVSEFENFRAPGYEDTGKPANGYKVMVLENSQESLESLAELVRANEMHMPIRIDLEREAITIPMLCLIFVVQQLNSRGVDYSATLSNLFVMKEEIAKHS